MATIDMESGLGVGSIFQPLTAGDAPTQDALALAHTVASAEHGGEGRLSATVELGSARTLAADSTEAPAQAGLDATLPADTRGAAAALSEPAERALGDRYSYRRELGRGGMGRVDLYWDSDLMREVAVKRLLNENRAPAQTAERFLREARLTAALDHPNLVPVHDVGLTPSGAPFFVMKYVRGRPLSTLIRSWRELSEERALFPLSKRLRIFSSICSGVAYAHEHGVIHRDLKPGNVMIGEHGEITVMDLGLALILDGACAHLSSLFRDAEQSSISGTPLYMSPEQARGESQPDVRTDVYSLGAILFELASLRAPVSADSVTAMLEKVARGDVRRIDDTAPHLPRGLRAIIDTAMSHEPDRRYPSVAALQRDVETYLNGGSPNAEVLGPLDRMHRYFNTSDPRLARVTRWELELIFFASLMCGASLALLITRGWNWPALALLAVGAILSIPGTITVKNLSSDGPDEP